MVVISWWKPETVTRETATQQLETGRLEIRLIKWRVNLGVYFDYLSQESSIKYLQNIGALITPHTQIESSPTRPINQKSMALVSGLPRNPCQYKQNVQHTRVPIGSKQRPERATRRMHALPRGFVCKVSATEIFGGNWEHSNRVIAITAIQHAAMNKQGNKKER